MVERGNVHSAYKYEEDDDQEHPALSGYESPAAMVTAEYATRAGKAVESANKTR